MPAPPVRYAPLACLLLVAAGCGRGGADQVGEAAPVETPAALVDWAHTHDGASLVVWDVAGDSAVVDVRGDVRRPVAGLTGLLLAAELARRAGRSLDTAAVLPASAVERRRLPGVDPPRPDARASSLAGLARRALAGDRAAADVLLSTLGREATGALPHRLGLDELDAPLPLGGLVLAWAPADRPGPREAQLASFLALGRPAQRDSAFARSRAYVKSPSYRAAERARLERGGLGLSPTDRRAAARATLPQGTARAYARLLARAVREDLVDADVSAAFLDLVPRPARDSLGERGGLRLGVAEGVVDGVVGAAAVAERGRGGRIAVLLADDGVQDASALLLDLARADSLGE
ncbi:serine hydrolase [Rubrivirga sp. S365]|uniref:Serine hydrolase n=1 Tax=Rubrivirga litoralis TaxID=3075598 RepID=A0ABU3BPA0_9BACT|nr:MULTISPECIES: serine hydrolase [unclassified Rubrivirga]MDT0631121.1 serine hydrolase [Rubrivirga sp. F394]MDT7855366.1 serine hydrolase [Rubrivirga sp. S365]